MAFTLKQKATLKSLAALWWLFSHLLRAAKAQGLVVAVAAHGFDMRRTGPNEWACDLLMYVDGDCPFPTPTPQETQ